VEVVDRVLGHHVRGEDLLVSPSHLQVTVAVVGQQHESVPRVLGLFQQPGHRVIGPGNVELRHWVLHRGPVRGRDRKAAVTLTEALASIQGVLRRG
jgi:hypothetical protein